MTTQVEGYYDRFRPLFVQVADEVQFALCSTLNRSGIKVAKIEKRVKKRDSFLEKLSRKDYDDPAKITDFAGVRVVCLFGSDLSRVASSVVEKFEVHEEIDKLELLADDKMGYQGRHFVVRFGGRYSGSRYDEIRELPCEIQVRTVLQDAWAQISHYLAYKSEASVPRPLLRSINNLSSLLEVAQESFDRVRDLRQSYIEKVELRKEEGVEFLGQPIDHETLAAYTRWRFPDLPVNALLQEKLLEDLDKSRFKTLADIDNAVNRAAEAVHCYAQENPVVFKTGTDYLTKSLGFVDLSFRNKHGFATRTRSAFTQYADKCRVSG